MDHLVHPAVEVQMAFQDWMENQVFVVKYVAFPTNLHCLTAKTLKCYFLYLNDLYFIFTGRPAQKRSHAGIAFTQWSKNSFLRSAPPCQILRLSGQKYGIQPPKLSNFCILAINLPLRGDSFAQLLRNFQRLYASLGRF